MIPSSSKAGARSQGTGRYRKKGADGAPDTAWVTDRSISFAIGEDLYRWRGYQPPFDDLPWQHELPEPDRHERKPIRRR